MSTMRLKSAERSYSDCTSSRSGAGFSSCSSMDASARAAWMVSLARLKWPSMRSAMSWATTTLSSNAKAVLELRACTPT
jgi:hypothetical protein